MPSREYISSHLRNISAVGRGTTLTNVALGFAFAHAAVLSVLVLILVQLSILLTGSQIMIIRAVIIQQGHEQSEPHRRHLPCRHRPCHHRPCRRHCPCRHRPCRLPCRCHHLQKRSPVAKQTSQSGAGPCASWLVLVATSKQVHESNRLVIPPMPPPPMPPPPMPPPPMPLPAAPWWLTMHSKNRCTRRK